MGIEAMTAILEIQDAFEIDLRDIVVVEKPVGSGRDGEEDGGRGQKEKSAEVGLDGSARGQQSNWRQGEILRLVSCISGGLLMVDTYHDALN